MIADNGGGLLCRLGYVMTQALVEFGADAAIVDLNGLSSSFRDWSELT